MTTRHVLGLVWRNMLTSTNAASPKRTKEHGRKRVNAKLTEEQVLQILDLRERRGWSALRIAMKMKIKPSQAEGVYMRGCGMRTIALKQH